MGLIQIHFFESLVKTSKLSVEPVFFFQTRAFPNLYGWYLSNARIWTSTGSILMQQLVLKLQFPGPNLQAIQWKKNPRINSKAFEFESSLNFDGRDALMNPTFVFVWRLWNMHPRNNISSLNPLFSTSVLPPFLLNFSIVSIFLLKSEITIAFIVL